jgi:hypothetical protein
VLERRESPSDGYRIVVPVPASSDLGLMRFIGVKAVPVEFKRFPYGESSSASS